MVQPRGKLPDRSGMALKLLQATKTKGLTLCQLRSGCGSVGYSSFGIGVDRRHALKWLFHQEKATLQYAQKVYVYSETALASRQRRRTTSPTSDSCRTSASQSKRPLPIARISQSDARSKQALEC